MINVSNAFRKELYSGNRKYLEYIDITLKSGKVLNLTNKDIWNGGFTIEDAVSNENSFNIGATIINQFTGVINNIYDEFSDYDFADAKVIPYVGLELPDGTIEKIQKGIFTVSEPKYNGSIITLTCYDNMAKFDRPYTESTLVYPATLNQIVRDACSKCDVTLQTYDFPHDDFVVQERPSDEATTFREVIGWAAQIACCFARCDRYGRLELKWFDTTAIDNGGLDGGYFDPDNPYSSGDDADGGSFNPWNTGYVYDSGEFSRLENAHHIYSNYSINISTDDVVITGVKVLEKAPDSDSSTEIVTYMTGQEGYVISIEGNELIKNGAGQTVVGWIGQAIIGLRFRKADFQHTSDPTIEAGDVAILTDRKQRSYNILISATTFSIGGSQSTRSSAEDPLKNSATRFSEATKNYVEYRKEIQKEKTDREQAIEELTNKINNSSGLYTTEVVQPDGSTIFNLHNKPVLAESDIIWRMTAEAWGVSTDGGETYNAGMTVDGDTIVRILTATGINAGWINTGAISVRNSSGKEVFYVDVDTGQVRIVANSFSLSNGGTIDSIAQSKVDVLDDDLDQNGVFNRLTNGGQTQGIYLKNGRVYINGDYIQAGTISGDHIKGGTIEGAVYRYGNDTEYTKITGEKFFVTNGIRAILIDGQEIVVGNKGSSETINYAAGSDTYTSLGDGGVHVGCSGDSFLSGHKGYVNIWINEISGIEGLTSPIFFYDEETNQSGFAVVGDNVNNLHFVFRTSPESSYLEIQTIFGTYGLNAWSSDIRDKEDIEYSASNGIEVINKIKHRKFRWKDIADGLGENHEGFPVDCGYIAQEMQEINPRFVITVSKGTKNERLQINESSVIPYITKAIQELADKVSELQKENAKLKNALKHLKKEVFRNGNSTQKRSME